MPPMLVPVLAVTLVNAGTASDVTVALLTDDVPTAAFQKKRNSTLYAVLAVRPAGANALVA